MLTPADLKPLLRGHYTTPQAMWQALGRQVPFVATLVGKRVGLADRDELTSDVLDDLARRVERAQGLDCNLPEDKHGAWFASCVRNSSRDVERARRRHAARFEDVEPDPGVTPPPDEPKADAVKAHPVWDALEDDSCPPNYRLALKAWHVPQRFSRRDVDAMAADVPQGKTDQKAGLARPVERTWPLLVQIAQRCPDGVARRRAAIDRFAFTVRSDAQRYSDWAADKKVARAARETVGKWHVRGRRWLEKRVKR